MLSEAELLERLSRARRVFLLEPPFRRKYLPLGLAKIATFVKSQGGRVWYGRRYLGPPVDLICATSLFTYDSDLVVEEVLRARRVAPRTPVIVGGVYASLVPSDVLERCGDGVEVFPGYSRTLDQCVPDYSMQWEMDDPWPEFSFTFTSRGCPNRCPYCAVWRIERTPWMTPNWQDHIRLDKPCAMVSDNNLSSTPNEHLFSVLSYLERTQRKVVFDNGLDVKHITDEIAARLARLRYTRHGMRTAFDRIEEDGVFQTAIGKLIGAGVPRGEIMVYSLFNFREKPKEAMYRLDEIRKLGLRPYPTMFTPLHQVATRKEESFVGKHWTRQLVRAFRSYWLFAGVYTQRTFEDWAREQDKIALTEEDWACWDAA